MLFVVAFRCHREESERRQVVMAMSLDLPGKGVRPGTCQPLQLTRFKGRADLGVA